MSVKQILDTPIPSALAFCAGTIFFTYLFYALHRRWLARRERKRIKEAMKQQTVVTFGGFGGMLVVTAMERMERADKHFYQSIADNAIADLEEEWNERQKGEGQAR
jgi:uncharacterized membrane protein YsdA (DUF1294 family)